MSTTAKEVVKQYYDEKMVAKLRNYVHGNARVEAAYAALQQRIEGKPLRHVLEIGCGVGYIAHALKQTYPQAEVWGFDISQKSIACATDLFAGEGLRYVQADTLDSWTCPEHLQFDLMVLMDVYEHIPPTERAAVHSWMQRHLAPDGLIFLSCPTPDFLAWCKQHEPHSIQPVDEDITPHTLLALAADTHTELQYYALQQVWRRYDYFHAVLGRPQGIRPRQVSAQSTHLPGRLWRKLKGRWQRQRAMQQQANRKAYIFQKTGIRI
jgi:cyclopropane fatty-acyl-phospholipid synthase-like methyltransferase